MSASPSDGAHLIAAWFSHRFQLSTLTEEESQWTIAR
jgi:hypothetical protein